MIWFAEGSRQGTQANVYADEMSDVTSELPQFATENHLKHGSSCVCIETSEVFIMKTDGTWKKYGGT